MPSISIIGVGAIGGTVGAHLCDVSSVEAVQLCVRRSFDHLRLESPNRTIDVDVRTVTEPEKASLTDWIFVATKAHQTRTIKPWLERLCNSSTKIAVLQNGVEHRQRIQELVDCDSVLPVVVDCPAIKNGDGYIQQKGSANFTVDNGLLGQAFQQLLAHTVVDVELSDDINTVAWKKLCLNVAGGAIAALTNEPLSVLHQPGMADLAKQLIAECIAVGRCERATLEDILADEIVDSMLAHSQQSLTSMLVDKRAGKILEVDARNGAVVRLGKKHGIETPLNAMATTILLAANQSSSLPSV